MPIPDYQSLMLPLLQFAADALVHTNSETVDMLATKLQLTASERQELLPSGQQEIFRNRIGWAKSYLKKAGLLTYPRRATLQITPRGKQVLAENPPRLDIQFLKQFPEFTGDCDSPLTVCGGEQAEPLSVPIEQTPEEALECAYQSLRATLAQDMLTRILACSPAFFERLVVELLVKMGYGGSRRDAGARIGQSGDGGIDGIIKEDRLGLDVIYLQAKRWQGSVGRPEIQKFVGALEGQRAKKGVFITTSSYTAEAREYAASITAKVVLIDGKLLTNLMMDFDVGVSVAASYHIKRIDSDYFEEGEIGL